MTLITQIEDENLYAQVLDLLAPGMFDGRVHTIHEVPSDDVRFIRADSRATWRERKRMKIVVVAAVLTGSIVHASQALADAERACIGWEYRVDHRTPLSVRERRIRRLIHCVFSKVGIPSQGGYAVTIADRESGLAPWALNPSSGAAGLFQHIQSYWPGRARALPREQFPRWPDSSVFRARPNVWAAARMVKASGWGAWTTAY